MDTNASGQLGGLESTENARKKMAAESLAWKCPGCDRTNGEIMKERQDAASQQKDSGKSKDEEIPEELKLAYREDLKQQQPAQSPSQASQSAGLPTTAQPAPSAQETLSSSSQSLATTQVSINPDQSHGQSTSVPVNTRPIPTPTQTVVAGTPLQAIRQSRSSDIDWIDKAIWGVIAALVLMVLRKYL